MLIWRSAAWSGLLFLLLPFEGLAQAVTLTSRDGSVQISGDLIGYDGEFYRVDTIYGLLTVDGSGVLCTGPDCPDPTTYVPSIRMAGEPVILDHLMPALIDAFAERNGFTVLNQRESDVTSSYLLNAKDGDQNSARIVLRRMNTREAFADLLAEETDLVLAAREITSDEVALGLDAGLGQLDSPTQSGVLALDAIVPIVSRANPIKNISPQDLAAVFQGNIRNWQHLGGIDAPLYLHSPQDLSATSQVFAPRVLGGDATSYSRIERHDDLNELVQAVAADQFSFGIALRSRLGKARALPILDNCGSLSIATPQAIKSEDYPLTAPYFVYRPMRRLPTIGRDFLRFALSSEAQHVVREAGFVDQGLVEIPISQQGSRLSSAILAINDEAGLNGLQNMMAELDGFNRLSATFRFVGDTTILDARSKSNLPLLAKTLELDPLPEKKIIFAGFSDRGGAVEPNRGLSEERANTVREAIIAEATGVDMSLLETKVLEFGDVLPIACGDSVWSERINQRIEIWVR